ncbi:MAG: peroxiredoxin [Ornithinibacter sp.]
MSSHVTPLSIGQVAPDFTLPDQNGVDVRLSDLTADKNVVIVFYPFAFSGICTGELDEIRDHLERFVSDDLQVVCISCDAMFSQRAWADLHGYFFPILADHWPHGAVTRSYGVFNEASGAPVRGTFLVGRDGLVHWTLVNGPGERRDFTSLPLEVAAIS